MSTAAVETPPLETTVTPPAVTPKPTAGVIVDLDHLFQKPEKTAPPADDAAAKEAEAKKTEEAKKEEVVKTTPPPAVKSNDKEENMANLRKAREAAEEKAKALETQIAEFQKKLEEASVPKVPEDFQKRMEETEKEREELRKIVRVANLERDPKFQKKYTEPIKQSMEQMFKLALDSGIDEKEALRAVNKWDEDTFSTWHESMSPAMKVKFGAAWTEVEKLHIGRQRELADADKQWAEQSKQQEEEMKTQHQQTLAENEKMARGIVKELLSTNEALKEYEDLPAAMETVALKAARYEMTPAEVFRSVASTQVLARVTMKQAKTIEDLTKKVADLQKFVDEQSSAVPKGNGTTVASTDEEKVPLWDRVVVKA